MNCPLCNVPLQMSSREGIEIDYCPQCRGVWLDRGELDKIIERSAAGAPPRQPGYDAPRQPTYRQPEYQQQHHKKKKHQSFLGELFDFD